MTDPYIDAIFSAMRGGIQSPQDEEAAIDRLEDEFHRLRTQADRLTAENRAAAAELEQARKWEAFGRAMLKDWPEPYGACLDGFDLQELGEKHGVLIGTEHAEPCGDDCNCVAEYGADEFPITCYRVLPTKNSDPIPQDSEVAGNRTIKPHPKADPQFRSEVREVMDKDCAHQWVGNGEKAAMVRCSKCGVIRQTKYWPESEQDKRG